MERMEKKSLEMELKAKQKEPGPALSKHISRAQKDIAKREAEVAKSIEAGEHEFFMARESSRAPKPSKGSRTFILRDGKWVDKRSGKTLLQYRRELEAYQKKMNKSPGRYHKHPTQVKNHLEAIEQMLEAEVVKGGKGAELLRAESSTRIGTIFGSLDEVVDAYSGKVKGDTVSVRISDIGVEEGMQFRGGGRGATGEVESGLVGWP